MMLTVQTFDVRVCDGRACVCALCLCVFGVSRVCLACHPSNGASGRAHRRINHRVRRVVFSLLG